MLFPCLSSPARAQLRLESFQGAAGRRSQLANEMVGDLTGDRKLAFAFKSLDGMLRVGVDDAARLDLAIAAFGKSALQCDYARRRERRFDHIVVARCNRMQRGN